ncbi:hypothetical protein PSAL_012320 [Pseudooceanicola algae]|uniref:Uncharacterized protein n=1 Tax=Pseudooceanicola algae TaxID=1537215 RepID=A0A418SC94_9RHOB|nr:hypothetical protein PSAL_012320 [Pseudooceanicola algae]
MPLERMKAQFGKAMRHTTGFVEPLMRLKWKHVSGPDFIMTEGQGTTLRASTRILPERPLCLLIAGRPNRQNVCRIHYDTRM